MILHKKKLTKKRPLSLLELLLKESKQTTLQISMLLSVHISLLNNFYNNILNGT